VFYDNHLYEGTGLYGSSSIRKVDLATGEVLQIKNLATDYFGEGITILNDKLIQLTWKEKQGFIYDKSSFNLTGTFNYSTEGWGLTHDGDRLIMSDGTEKIYFLDPVTFEILDQLRVMYNGVPVTWLNELEYINGELYANVWQTDLIVRICPVTGEVQGWINLTGLLSDEHRVGTENVLNGIAYDTLGDRLFVTGKNWPKVYEVKLIKID
jgi:glutamine cyclotransferase